MKLILNLYKDISFGNCKVDSLILTTNKMPVSLLKKIISQKYDKDKSSIILSVKMHNLIFVIMVDNFPLYFYNIKENSMIYIEIIEKPKKNEEMLKKIKERENKSSFLKRLNIFKNDNMDIINESPLEDFESENEEEDLNNNINDENDSFKNNINIENKDNNIQDLSKLIEKRFTNAIINNNLLLFREIIKHYKDKIEINKPLGKSQKYSPIHYVSIFGYSQMFIDLILKYNADVNLISRDGWSSLHICSFKGNINIIHILLKLKKIKFNISLPNLGTPLHCACQQNNISMVSLLLTRSSADIKNINGLLPKDLTKDRNIIKLINKVMNVQNNFDENLDKSGNNNANEINSEHLEKYSFLKELKILPNFPPRYVGFCYKRGKRFYKYNARYIELNALKNLFLRFKYKEDYPYKTKEVLILSDIISCKLLPNKEGDNYFFIEIVIDDEKQLLRFESLKVCTIWIEKINTSIDFAKFWIKMAKKYDDVSGYLNTKKVEIFEIDYFSGEIRKFVLSKEDKEKVKIMKNEIVASNKVNLNNTSNIEKKKEEKGNNNSNIENEGIKAYEFKKIIFTSNIYRIYKVKHKYNENYYLMKVFNTNNLLRINQLDSFNSEIDILKQVNFMFCISLFNSFQIGDNLYLILDYCPNNNLSFYSNRILFEENSIKIYVAEIILAIEYLHKLEFSFNNLSLENILITKDNHIKLTDLQLNKIDFTYNNGVKLGNGIDQDIYAIGSIIYELVTGIAPLYITNVDFKSKKKVEELYLFNFFSNDLKDLLSKLLCKDPEKRIGVKNKKEIKSHAWFKKIDWDNLLMKSTNPSVNFSLIKKEIEDSSNILQSSNHN